MKKINFIFTVFIALTLHACQDKYPDLKDGIYAEFITDKGTFVVKLHHDQTPITVANFVDLAEGKNAMVDSAYKGKAFYNGLTFHRIIKDFMIQGGDPKGDGTGDPGYRFPDEFVEALVHDRKGILSMANSGPATNGSQFFITLKETPWLNGVHTVFGEVVLGIEVVDTIGDAKPATAVSPAEKVIIQQVNIIRKGNIKLDSFEKQMQNIEKERLAKEDRVNVIKQEVAKELESLKATAEELPSGLKILFTKRGNGVQPSQGQTIGVNYEGYLPDGTLFDSNLLAVVEKYEMVNEARKNAGQYLPMEVPYNNEMRMIAGFKEGILNMKVGDEAILFIPAYLGWGEPGAGNVIPPNADVIFRVSLVE